MRNLVSFNHIPAYWYELKLSLHMLQSQSLALHCDTIDRLQHTLELIERKEIGKEHCDFLRFFF